MREKEKNPYVSEEILDKARHYEESSLATITRVYYPKILHYFYYRSKSREDTEDLTVEVFIRLVKAINRQTGNFEAWLYRIARNLLTDYYRKTGKVKEISLEGSQLQFRDEKEDGKEKFNAADIRTMVNTLNEDQKQVIIMKFVENNTNEEIAAIMNKSIGAVKALQFRAILALKERFGTVKSK